jgi:putative ABC transport system permease protein
MVLSEALLLTAFAGYVGLTAGVALVEVVRRHLPENEYLRNPSLDVRVAFIATLLLIGAGALAGLLPALAAARVRPIVAMRET